MEHIKFLDFAKKIARELGDATRTSFGNVATIDKKLRHDIVTDIDFRNEKRLVRAIRKQFPDHAILAEEMGRVGPKKSDYLWIIDPIDGTINYAAGLPIFTISIALAYKDKVIVGVVYDPLDRKLYHAIKGANSCLDNDIAFNQTLDCTIGPTSNRHLKDALIYIGISTHDDLNKLDQSLKLWRLLHPNVRGIRMLGASALGIVQVGQGIFDAIIKPKADNFGSAAASLIAQQAGAKFTTFDGLPWHIDLPNYIVANPFIYEKLVHVIRKTIHGERSRTI